MGSTAPLDEGALLTGLHALLDQHPDALVAAIASDGIFVPWPDSLARTGQTLLPGRSALDFVVADDWPAVIDAWERARGTGAGRTRVRLANSAEGTAVLQYFDVRDRHGVYVGVVTGVGAGEVIAGYRGVEEAPPRLARVRKSETAVFVEIDEATTQILGWSADEMVGERSLDFIHPDDHERAIQSWMTMLASGQNGPRVRLRHRRSDGNWVWLEITNENFLDDPDRGYVLADMIDVTDEVAAHDALRRREELFGRLAEALPIGLIQVELDRHIVYSNGRLGEILGGEPTECLDEALATVVRDDWATLDSAIEEALRDGADADLELQVRRPDEIAFRRVVVKLRALIDDGPIGAIICIEDVTERAELHAELERRATFDILTGCLNRAAVMSALETSLAHGDRPYVAAVFIDVDDFKGVNDRYGHATGDDLLIAIAKRLTGAVRDGDLVGRLGGDEFIVVCPEVSDPDEAARFGDRLARALQGEVSVGGRRIELRSSLGVACAKRDGITAEELVTHADIAMYDAKRHRVNITTRLVDH